MYAAFINLKYYSVFVLFALFCYFCFERHSYAVKIYTFGVVRFDVLVEKRLYKIRPQRLVVQNAAELYSEK